MEPIIETILMELQTSSPKLKMFLSSFGRYEAFKIRLNWRIGTVQEFSDDFFDIKEKARMLTRKTEETYGAYFFEKGNIWKSKA